VNNGHSEYWLLSEAPSNPNEAINVAGSAVLAERCGVPHVVLISDACRTAPDSIHALAVTGGVMFRNQPPPPEGAGAVDQFYACLLGDPAYELRDPDTASRLYRSLYTEVLTEALTGCHPELVVWGGDGTDTGFIRPWPLKRRLGSLVTQRLTSLGWALRLNQTPDARLTSDPDTAWLSRFRLTPTMRPPLFPGAGGPTRGGLTHEDRGVATNDDLAAAVRRLVGRLVADQATLAEAADDLLATGATGSDAVHAAVLDLARHLGPRRLAAPAGFEIRGAAVTRAASASAGTEVLGGAFVRVFMPPSISAVEVALEFNDGACAVLPAFRDQLGTLSVHDGQLVDVAIEPMEGGAAWADSHRRSRLREIRAVVAAASRFGVLDFTDSGGAALVGLLSESADPSLAVYVAYALQDAGRTALIEQLRRSVLHDAGTSLFDLDLLTHRLDSTPGTTSLPLLSRGWALNVTSSPDPTFQELLVLRRLPSLWTLFAPGEWGRIRTTLTKGGQA
jgi:hypothetical protein